MISQQNLMLATLVILLPVLLLSQGVITGNVLEKDGDPIAGANLVLEGTSMGAASRMDGSFTIRDIIEGQYIIKVTAIGYKDVEKEINVKDGKTINLRFELSTDILGMSSVVVSGTPGGIGKPKKDASYSVNTLSEIEIKRSAPRSTADLLKTIPGVWAESSGGVAGANIFVRGMPSSGDAPFVTMAINGGPLYGTETLSFFEHSSIFRVDETVKSTEALRGGPNAVFSNGEPGLTVNFNLKKGGEVSKGRLKYETSDYGKKRVDGVMSGKVADGLYYMAGGYVRTSHGIRNTEFNSENGKQFTLQITKSFDNGIINVFSRLTDDHGQWVLPMALETGNEHGTFAQIGNATRFRALPTNALGDSATFDFANGRGWKGSVSGINASFDLGAGWKIHENLTYTAGEANTFGFVPQGNPIQVSALGRNEVTTQSGQVLDGSDWVQNYGHWVVMKNLESINNDLSFNKKMEKHEVTFGIYQARWSSVDFWTLGNFIPVHNVENGEMLQDDITADTLAAYGAGGPWNYGIQSGGDASVLAFYGADSWQIKPVLRLDLGLRYEFFNLEYSLDAGSVPDGNVDNTESLNGEEYALTAALNYDLTESIGTFIRYSDGYLFPHFDMIREGKYSKDGDEVDANDFKQYELGLKYDSQLFSIFATTFLNNVDVFDGDVGAARESALLNTQTMGLELDGAFSINDFTLRGIGTYQQGEIKESDVAPEVEGNEIWRQPNWQVRISPSYDLKVAGSLLTLYGSLRSVGKRWSSRNNTYQLDGYTTIDAGINIATPQNMSFRIHVNNLTDSDGLTEGDPRDPATANGRPIFGRSIGLSATYDF